ncbi:MAG: hypothetical protein A2W90_06315 [Bacteroidetes bacterium GWF2_42_66]|nr:MAG: hypothetical protein A2W92_20825 [Bacteroidetes bacterium GWA2_42_15]OFX99641.1 MAG: hypothetical protein A2W89_00440 [Bacteroidetes bacterium GWE2_42_39]OFY39540.1 MAG: hypothetical protein A2W90_06315 [Bacteroidetes bacterium GWF2_42_66]HBL73608.1 hypothetical protein [Prolixibacteraceae bacterium]HCR90272.1 hypothetical protein [Prolixibacteraceae bacterium]
MKVYKILSVLIFFCVFSASGQEISLNGIWSFKYFPTPEIGKDSLFCQNGFDTQNWYKIKVPGHWDLQGFADPSEGSPPPMVGLYRTSFTLPETMKGKQIFIRFEGVQYGYDFYVNGKYVASFASSYNPASFNITKLVNFFGENNLAVKVSVQVKGYEFDTNDCWRLSGIYRSVLIYSTSNFHIDDYTVQTSLQKTNSEANINVAVDFQDSKNEGFSGLSLKGILRSPEGKTIGTVIQPVFSLNHSLSFEVENPVLWTAETPSLYKLELLLTRGKNILDRKVQSVGIRQIGIENKVMKLNGSPLKLRGINHHDLVPETGRTLTRKQILDDLKLIQQANINFIRTSHYPPDYRMLDLCDSLGIYVMCEVPFGGGDGHLTNSTYQDILLMRAKATLLRDKNHPCVIVWSVGNENMLTPITEVVGKYVQKADPTRPTCYPQTGTYFYTHYKLFPDFLDLYAPHYQGASWIKEFQKGTNKPVILTEYAHALGLSFGNLENIWAELFRNDHFAGGAVWHFHDQGVIRKSREPVDRFQSTVFVWKDSVTYYDTRKTRGTDGIVYSDRTPQTDYWQVRKVYSPVQVIETKLPVVAGKQTLKFSVYNQYDFLNLSVLQGKWTLYKNRKVIQTGKLTVNCAPHDTVFLNVPVVLPASPETNIWYLQLDFQDKNKMQVYNHTIELTTNQGFNKIREEILEEKETRQLSVEKGSGKSSVSYDGFSYDIGNKDLSVQIQDNSGGNSLIVGGLYARAGRVPKISDSFIREGESEDIYWEPHLLPASQVEKQGETNSGGSYHLSANASFLRGEKYPGQKLAGNINYAVSGDGILSVSYTLKPENTTGMFLETGVSFALSEQITDFIWLGDGPYASYPDKHFLADYGIHYLKKGDLNFNGNRANVDVAVLCDSKGNGIAILGDRSNISVEVINKQIVVSHNAKLMGMGNKGSRALVKLFGNSVGEINGEFRIIPLRANQWPTKLVELLGNPNPSIRPFQPFYHSYDYSW